VTEFRNIQSIHILFTNRDGVPTALTIDGTAPMAELSGAVTVDDDGLAAAVEVSGVVPNGTGYGFWSLEDWELRKVKRGQAGRSRPEPKPLGKVGQAVLTVVALAILAPFVGILWAWGMDVVRSFG